MPARLLNPERRWECPNCNSTDVTYEAQPHIRYHSCRGLYGLSAPMVPAGSDSRVKVVVREDYVGKEIVTTDDNGRPIMSIVTERPDGSNDCTVLAPVATASGQ